MSERENRAVAACRPAPDKDDDRHRTSTCAEGNSQHPRWPASLSDDELAALSRRLDHACRDIDVLNLPTPELADITEAAAVVRIILRRRRARRRLDAARQALVDSGWSA